MKIKDRTYVAVEPLMATQTFMKTILETQTAILKELTEIKQIAKDEQKWRIHTEGGFKE